MSKKAVQEKFEASRVSGRSNFSIRPVREKQVRTDAEHERNGPHQEAEPKRNRKPRCHRRRNNFFSIR